jgi:hypothetical protein
MARQNINIGTTADDGTGDNLRSAFDKVNDNFIEVYNSGPVGSNITISGAQIKTTATNANLVLYPDGTGTINIKNDLVPDTDNLRYVGSANLRPIGIYAGTAGVISSGPVTVPKYANTTVRDATITTPVAGMIVFTGTIFQGYNGSAWVDFNS